MGAATPATIRSTPADEIQVRPFQSGDHVACAELLASCDRGERTADRIEWWQDQHTNGAPSIVVATVGDELVGFLALRVSRLGYGAATVPTVVLDGCVIDPGADRSIVREELRETGIEYAAHSGYAFAVDTMAVGPESAIERSSWTAIGLQEQHVRIQSISRYLPDWLGSQLDPPLRRMQSVVTDGRRHRQVYSRSFRRRMIDVVTVPGIRETAGSDIETGIAPRLSPATREWLSAAPTIEWFTAVAYENGDPVGELLIAVDDRSTECIATVIPANGVSARQGDVEVWHALVGTSLDELSTVDRIRAPGGRQFSTVLRQWGFLSLERFPFSLVTDPRLVRIRRLDPGTAWDDVGMDLRSPTNWRDGSYDPLGDVATIGPFD